MHFGVMMMVMTRSWRCPDLLHPTLDGVWGFKVSRVSFQKTGRTCGALGTMRQGTRIYQSSTHNGAGNQTPSRTEWTAVDFNAHRL